MDGQIEKLFQLFETLNNDVKTSVIKLNDCSDDEFDFYARAYLRAYASWVEGVVWMYKNLISKIEDGWHKTLPTEYQLYLLEYDWRIGRNGEPLLQQKKIKTKENLKGFFYVMSHMFDGFKVETDKGEWSDVMYFYRLRDSTMHPSSLDSLIISINDIEICDRGRVWLERVFQELNKNISQRTKT